MIYEKDKTHRMTLRLNDEQFAYVIENSEALGISPTDCLRMIINSSLNATKLIINKMKEGICRENEKADQHDLV